MSSIDSSQFARSAAEFKSLPSILFLISEEESIASDCLKLFRQTFTKLHGDAMIDFNQDIFYGEKEDISRILDACATLPVGMTRRLVILHQADKMPSEAEEALENYMSSPNPSTALAVVWNGKPTPQALSKGLPALAEKNGMVVKCWKMGFEEKRADWAKAQAQLYKKELTREAAILLARDAGESLRDLKNEVEKVVLFVGDKKTIEGSDIRQTMSFRADQIIWDFVNGLEAGQSKKAGLAMERMLEQGDEPVMLLNMMARSARRMVQNKGGKSRVLQLELFRELRDTDLALKSGHGLEAGLFERLIPAYAALAS